MKNLITLKKFCLVVAIVGLLHTIVDAEVREIKLKKSFTSTQRVLCLDNEDYDGKSGYSLANILQVVTSCEFVAADGGPFELRTVNSTWGGPLARNDNPLTEEADQLIREQGIIFTYDVGDWDDSTEFHTLTILASFEGIRVCRIDYTRQVSKKIPLTKEIIVFPGIEVPVNMDRYRHTYSKEVLQEIQNKKNSTN